MGWNYYEYMNQPAFFIEEILLIMNQEGQKEKRETDRMNRQSKSLPRKH